MYKAFGEYNERGTIEDTVRGHVNGTGYVYTGDITKIVDMGSQVYLYTFREGGKSANLKVYSASTLLLTHISHVFNPDGVSEDELIAGLEIANSTNSPQDCYTDYIN